MTFPKLFQVLPTENKPPANFAALLRFYIVGQISQMVEVDIDSWTATELTQLALSGDLVQYFSIFSVMSLLNLSV